MGRLLINPASANMKIAPASANQKVYPCFTPHDGYYVDITIDKTQVGAEQTDFPICLQGNEMPAGFWSHVGTGSGLFVTDARTSRRYHREIEYLSVGDEKVALHTRIPTLGTEQDHVIRLYYGGSQSGVDTSMVWDSSFEFVSHMADYNAGTQIWDSTKNRNHGTKGAEAQAPTEVAGTVGRAQQFVAASEQYIALPDNASVKPDAFTCFAVVSGMSDIGAIQHLLGWGNYLPILAFDYSTNRAIIYMSAGNYQYFNSTEWATLANGALHSVAFSLPGAVQDSIDNASMWIDGAAWAKSGGANKTTAQGAKSAPYIGAKKVVGADCLNAIVNELRLSSVARSAEWIALTHLTLLDPTTLYGISAEQSV